MKLNLPSNVASAGSPSVKGGVCAVPSRVADGMVRWLAEHGVRRIFGIPGGAISPVFDAMVDSELDTVVCQHETMAVYLATGTARATGVPGVVAVTSGPGLTNALTGVTAAFLDEVPLLLLAGEVRTAWDGRGAIQDGGERGINVMGMFRNVVRHSATIERADDAMAALAQAWAAATQHPRGPVLLRIPVDVGGLLAGPPVEARSPVAAHPDPAEIERAARLLADAERPLLLIGNGAKAAGVGELIARLAAKGRIPVATDLEGKGLVPESSATALGVLGFGTWPAAERYVAGGVDVLAIIGSRLDDTTTSGFTLRARHAMIQIDHDPSRLHRLGPADVAIVADLEASVSMLYEALPRPTAAAVLGRDAAIREARASRPEPVAELYTDGKFNPHAVVGHLQSAFDPTTVFVSDIGNHQLFAARRLSIETPDAFHVSGGLGGMGSGIGLAIGLAMAYDGARTVVGVTGDGCMLMAGTELATCARYGIPVVLCVFDDGQLGMVEHGMRRVYGRSQIGAVPTVDLTAFARALGVTAYDLTPSTDLNEVADRGRAGPVLVRIPIDPNVTAANPRDAGFKPDQQQPDKEAAVAS